MDAIELKKRLEAAAAHGNPGEAQALLRETQAAQFESELLIARIGLALAMLLSFGGGVAFISVGATLPPLVASSAVTMIGAGCVLFGIAAGVGFIAFNLAPPPTELARTGLPAKAKVEDYLRAFGSMSIGSRYVRRNLTRLAVDLTVLPWNAAPYRVTITQYFSGSSVAAMKVGATLDAFVDLARRERVLLVFP